MLFQYSWHSKRILTFFFNIDIYNKRTNILNILFIDISTPITFLCGQYSITTC